MFKYFSVFPSICHSFQYIVSLGNIWQYLLFLCIGKHNHSCELWTGREQQPFMRTRTWSSNWEGDAIAEEAAGTGPHAGTIERRKTSGQPPPTRSAPLTPSHARLLSVHANEQALTDSGSPIARPTACACSGVERSARLHAVPHSSPPPGQRACMRQVTASPGHPRARMQLSLSPSGPHRSDGKSRAAPGRTCPYETGKGGGARAGAGRVRSVWWAGWLGWSVRVGLAGSWCRIVILHLGCIYIYIMSFAK